MHDWQAALQRLDETVQATFDDVACTMKPRAAGVGVNHGRQDDPSRVPFGFFGSIDLQPSGDLMARNRSADPSTGKANPYFDAVLTALVTAWPWLPRKDDHVIADGVTWKIMAEATDGGDRRAWYINRN